MKKRFIFGIMASIFMILTAAVSMNAQTDLPWHVVVHDSKGKEVANHSVEIITDVEVTSQAVGFVLTSGQNFAYPITSTFTFEQRAGNGTAIEVINAPKWNVYYNGSSLHFTESVNSVAVYSVSGILVAKVSGNYTDVPVNLAKGIYIVQAGGKTVKLLVSSSGSGAAYAQPTVAESAPQVSYAPASSSPVTLRSANAAVTKQYWNVHYNNTVIAVEIAQVSSFYFTSDNSVVFALVNGSTVQLPNYQTIDFAAQPAQSGSKWNMNMTMKFGGAAYGANSTLPPGQWYTPQYVTAFTASEIICYDVSNQVIRKYPINFIPNYDARVSMIASSSLSLTPGYSYKEDYGGGIYGINFMSLSDGSLVGAAAAQNYSGGSNLIQTTFSIDANDNLKVSFNGGEYTFK